MAEEAELDPEDQGGGMKMETKVGYHVWGKVVPLLP